MIDALIEQYLDECAVLVADKGKVIYERDGEDEVGITNRKDMKFRIGSVTKY
jgi:CubicO group peptidase (beta-lactamase class C family)